MKALICILLSLLLMLCFGCSQQPQSLPPLTTATLPPSVSISSPFDTADGPLYKIAVVTSLEDEKFVYARKEKGLDSDIVGAAAIGVNFAVTEQTDEWCRIIYGQKVGYILTRCLTIKPDMEALPQHEIFISVPEKQETGQVETKFNNKLKIVTTPYSENGSTRKGIDIYTSDGILLAVDASFEITDGTITAPAITDGTNADISSDSSLSEADNTSDTAPSAAVSPKLSLSALSADGHVPVNIVIKNGRVIESNGIKLKKDTGYNAGRDKGKVITQDKTVIEFGGEFLNGAVVTVTEGRIYGEDSEVEIQPNYYLVPKKLKDNLVDVAQYSDDIVIDMLFAKDGNLLGDKIYDYEVCLLQKGTLEKLEKAAQLFKNDGYTIVIYDAYRPYSVTEKLYEKYQNGEYVAPLRFGSVHNKGAAVDMSLLDTNGMAIEMPSQVHTLDSTSNRDNKNMTPAARANMDYMTKIMKSCGFDTIESEWWHFTDTENKGYLRTDYDLNSLLRIIYE